MQKTIIAILLGLSLAMLPAAVPLVSPPPAAAQATRIAGEEPDLLSFLVDLIIIRPFSLAVYAAAVITYPAAVVLDPLFRDDPQRLKEEWLDTPYGYAFERPLGNFRWRKR